MRENVDLGQGLNSWLKIGIYWVIIVIVLWAAYAATKAPNTNIALSYADKAVEFVLLGILLRIRATGGSVKKTS